MGLELVYLQGQTPLDDDEKDGLLVSTIVTRNELNEFEQKNIEDAVSWSIGRSFKPESLFTEKFIRDVHRQMFGQVWTWAGEFRKSNKNIGVDKWQIATELRNLLDDVKFWLSNKTFEPDEICIRFKHRLVSIHCFPNGNGRHSRLVADIVAQKQFRTSFFSWGNTIDAKKGEVRSLYLEALRTADKGNITPLLQFARI